MARSAKPPGAGKSSGAGKPSRTGRSAGGSKSPGAGKTGSGRGEVRIIGGEWRGRRLRFSAGEGLRPTLDRFRETLFNWLMYDVEGARCLDLFAGSGALGLEALSRGAQQVDFVDASATVCKDIRAHLHTLGSDKGRVWHSSAEAWLKTHTSLGPYTLIFLDPPFHQDLLQVCCHWLEKNGYLADNCKIYLEAEDSFERSKLPYNWRVLKQKDASNKVFFLLERTPSTPDSPA